MRISDWSSDVCSSDLLYFARQQVGERLLQAGENLPDGAQPQMGPVTTGLGEVVMYTVGYKNPDGKGAKKVAGQPRSEEHTSELQSLMRISYAVFCLKKKKNKKTNTETQNINPKEIANSHEEKNRP